MSEIGKKRTIKLFSSNLNSGGVQMLQPVYWDDLHKQHVRITRTGNIVLRRNFDKEGGEEGMVITLDKTRTLPDDKGQQWFMMFEVYDKPFPAEWDDAMKDLNKSYAGLEKFLKGHPEVSVKGHNGEELNPNCRQSRYIIEDDIAIAQDAFERTEQVTRAKTELSEIFKDEDPTLFTDLCYGMGIGNLVSQLDPKQLFNILAVTCDKNPQGFLGFVFSPERELSVVLHKASSPGPNGEAGDIARNGDSYYSNGNIIAKSFDELKLYFKNNQEEFKYLAEKYGKKKPEKKATALKK